MTVLRNAVPCSHYLELYRAARERPESLFNKSFIHQDHGWLDLVEDPLPYLGGRLCYTRAEDPRALWV